MKPVVAIALALLATAAHAGDLNDVKSKKQLVCGTQSASEPYAYQDPATRKFVGYDVDICQALAKGLGVELVHKPLSTEARIPELKMGRVDVVAGSMAYLPERAAQVDYSVQYLQGNIKVLVRKDDKLGTLAQLEGKRICASKGSSSAAIAGRVLAKSQIVTYQDLATCYLGLQNGKVDGISAGELTLKRFEIESAKSGSAATLIDEPLFTERMGVVASKGNTALIEAINKVISKMDGDGELDAIYAKWLGKDSIYQLTRKFKVEPVALAN
ncbi:MULTISPECIES: transporter substrate-binding domain-containing protein [Achromobacter]|uniref:ABC transporter substrate-binding protein n=1 Tax=Alcaligenes xylosoxydans xylosoxydans TaxID=85698 RepID=A0A424WE52_ALCXX|nr:MULTISPECIES: transporter substrate-binding domain-containing protein [Achromobacter]MBC9906121.1 transporter substrate-binding domain-containing protein [Achromobacter xylosoxidans]MBD0869909.1 transporter substrate-binding domain-containing protein [Achromobacter xylosoxidans]MDH1301214.1 transporter substrate-binding domain-containing protein [Achromobacter sp. GD03932]QNP85112.1 transporter substrate-binding domain-containing protein [Achromobacter xylosoxidans]RPJ91529.1 ABC transporte